VQNGPDTGSVVTAMANVPAVTAAVKAAAQKPTLLAGVPAICTLGAADD
jgi:hypothetical protein